MPHCPPFAFPVCCGAAAGEARSRSASWCLLSEQQRVCRVRQRIQLCRLEADVLLGGGGTADDDAVCINCSVRSLLAFIFCTRASAWLSCLWNKRQTHLGTKLEHVFEAMPMLASRDCSSMTTLELCSSTCFVADPLA